MGLAGIDNVNLGTAGTQSGDTIRDAFNKVNNNFGLLGSLAGCEWYYGEYESSDISVSGPSWTDPGYILINGVPAGDYLAMFWAAWRADAGTPNIRPKGIVDGGLYQVALFQRAWSGASSYYNLMSRLRKITLTTLQDIGFECRNKDGAYSTKFNHIALLLIGPL